MWSRWRAIRRLWEILSSKVRETSKLARTSLDTPQSCHEIHLTRTHDSFVRFLWYFSSSFSAWRQGTMMTSRFVKYSRAQCIFYAVNLVYLARRLSSRAFLLRRRSRVCGWRFCEKQKSLPLSTFKSGTRRDQMVKRKRLSRFMFSLSHIAQVEICVLATRFLWTYYLRGKARIEISWREFF